MAISLHLCEEAEAVADSVRKFAATAPFEAGFGRDMWKSVAELGIFSIPREFGDVAQQAVVAAMEELGRCGFPGPLAPALAIAAGAPAEVAEAVVAGDAVPSLGRAPLMPYAGHADLFVTECDGEAILLDVVSIDPVETLSGEDWGRVSFRTSRRLGPFAPWWDAHDVALAAWMIGAGLDLLEKAAEHARTREQFGRAIGEFQAVAIPLSRVAMALDAAQILTRAAATALDGGSPGLCAAARISSARAAKQAAITAHQTFGAMGVTQEGPVYAASLRIRELSSQFPGERRGLAAAATGFPSSLGLVSRGTADGSDADGA